MPKIYIYNIFHTFLLIFLLLINILIKNIIFRLLSFSLLNPLRRQTFQKMWQKVQTFNSAIFESRLELFVHGIYDTSIRTLVKETTKLVNILTYSQLLYSLLLIIHYFVTCKNLLLKEKHFCTDSRRHYEIYLQISSNNSCLRLLLCNMNGKLTRNNNRTIISRDS